MVTVLVPIADLKKTILALKELLVEETPSMQKTHNLFKEKNKNYDRLLGLINRYILYFLLDILLQFISYHLGFWDGLITSSWQ